MVSTCPTQFDTDCFPPEVVSSIQKIKNIATLPAVATKIMELVADAESSTQEIRKVIVADPALSACILKVVNSSFYGFPQQISTIDRAIILLGLNSIRNIAIATSLSKVFKSSLLGPAFDASELWIHSVAVASCAREISLRGGVGFPDELFLAGLMHDIGIMIEMQSDYSEFVKIIDLLAREPNKTFREAEQQILGATHEQFGACICREWHFPPQFELITRFHHAPLQLPEHVRPLPAVIHAADILSTHCSNGYARTVETDTIDPDVLRAINLTEANISELKESLPELIQEAQQLLGASQTA